ncbi:hypothetical protein F5B18DRAFT_594022 [Nemania serpens]|nr:hypothetical protein F5B18DRAFT_594022 [Nemania serpens]
MGAGQGKSLLLMAFIFFLFLSYFLTTRLSIPILLNIIYPACRVAGMAAIERSSSRQALHFNNEHSLGKRTLNFGFW